MPQDDPNVDADDPIEDARNHVNLLYRNRTGRLDGPKYAGERAVLPRFELEPDRVAPNCELTVCGLGLRKATALLFSPPPNAKHRLRLDASDFKGTDDPDKIRVVVPEDAVSGWVWADTPLGEMCSSKQLTIDSGGEATTSEQSEPAATGKAGTVKTTPGAKANDGGG